MNMKKFLIVMATVVFALALAACGDKNEEGNNQAANQNEEQTNNAGAENGANDAAANEAEEVAADVEEVVEEVVEEAPVAEVEGTVIDLSTLEPVFDQATGTVQDDGSVHYAGGTINKSMFALPAPVAVDETIKFSLSGKFNTADDTAIRLYLTNANFENCSEMFTFQNNGEESFTTTFELKATAEGTHLMIASSAFDTFFNDFTLTQIVVAE